MHTFAWLLLTADVLLGLLSWGAARSLRRAASEGESDIACRADEPHST